MTRIAIVGLNAYPAINPTASRNVGGLENFAWTFAQALAAVPPWQVTLLLRHSQPIPETALHGVRFVTYAEPLRHIQLNAGHCVRRKPSFPYLALQRWDPALLWQVPLLAVVKALRLRPPHPERLRCLLLEADAEVIVALGVNADSSAAIHAAKTLGKPIWLWLRSNGDIDERFFSDDNFVDPYAVSAADCRFCLHNATGILCQTDWQASRLKQLSGRDGVIIRNPVDLHRFPWPLPGSEERDTVLWLGRMDRFHKRPLLALEIARRCPDVPFLLIANRSDAAVESEVRATCPPNVTLRDYVPRSEIGAYYRRARVFLSTGATEHEGFPNVLLEAAACGTPIVSLENFDNFLTTSGCGIATDGDLEQAAIAVRQLWASTVTWQSFADRGRAYVEQHHSLRNCVTAFTEVCQPTTGDLTNVSPQP